MRSMAAYMRSISGSSALAIPGPAGFQGLELRWSADMTCQPQSRIATFLHNRDAEDIRADWQREIANSNREVDLALGNDVPLIRQHRVGNLADGGGEFLNRSEDHAAGRTDAVA